MRLTQDALVYLVETIGNNTAVRAQELIKLSLYQSGSTEPLTVEVVQAIVCSNIAAGSLQLADQLRQGQSAAALTTLSHLITRNEHPLAILQTLVSQVRTWLCAKAMLAERCHSDQAIAQAAEIGNPNRLYYLRQDVASLSLERLVQLLELLVETEHQIKQGESGPDALRRLILAQACA